MSKGTFYRLIIIFIVLLAALPQPALASEYVIPPAPSEFVTEKYDRFYIMHEPGVDYSLTDMYMRSSEAYGIMNRFFPDYDFNVTLEIATSHEQYEKLVGISNLSEATMGSGWGYGLLGKVVIKEPEINPKYKLVLAHELTHIATRTYMPGYRNDLPEWFLEGIAVYVSGDLSPDMRTFIEYRCRDEVLMTVDEMEVTHRSSTSSFNNPDMVGAAYAQSGMVVEHIAKYYGGNESILKVLKQFGNTGDLNASFQGVLGKSTEDVNREWRLLLKREIGVRDGTITEQKVYGHVYDQVGQPVANYTFKFTSAREDDFAKGRVYNATTDSNGYYEAKVTYGPIKVAASGEGYTYPGYSLDIEQRKDMLFNVRLLGEGPVAANGSTDADNGGGGGFGMLPALAGFVLADIVAIGVIMLVLKRKRK